MTVFNTAKINDNTKMFLDSAGPVGLQRYDHFKYPIFNKLYNQLVGFFWRAAEIDCTRDGKDFKSLTPHEQHIFTSNIRRQIVADSVQGRAPAVVLNPIVCLPELEQYNIGWTFTETIHSEAYTHVLKAVYPNPSEIVDTIFNTPEIMAFGADISKYYDRLHYLNQKRELTGYDSDPEGRGWNDRDWEYEHKKALWLCLNSINVLEGVRFYVSFACSWAFAENKKMEGNAKIIKLICRDENVHLAGTQHMLKLLPKDDPDFARIKEETKREVEMMFIDVVKQEEDWADYLFKDGSMIGLNAPILKDHVRGIAHKRMLAIGVDSPFAGATILPWTQKWISGGDVQVAPQEVESSQYINHVRKDVNKETFAGFDLG